MLSSNGEYSNRVITLKIIDCNLYYYLLLLDTYQLVIITNYYLVYIV